VPKILKLCLPLASFLLISCGSSDGLRSFVGLEQRVSEYYLLEQRNDWSETYEMRTAAFRKSVPKKFYVSQMEKDNAGWRLLKYRIDGVSERNGKVHVRMTFFEVPPPEFFKHRVPAGQQPPHLETEDESVWLKEGGIWYAYDAASRGRFSQNPALVP